MPGYFFGVLSQNYLFEVDLGNCLNDHNILTLTLFHEVIDFFCLLICCDSSI